MAWPSPSEPIFTVNVPLELLLHVELRKVSAVYLRLYSPCGLGRYVQSVGLLGRGIGTSQGRYLHTEETHTNIHVSSGIRTHDLSVRAATVIDGAQKAPLYKSNKQGNLCYEVLTAVIGGYVIVFIVAPLSLVGAYWSFVWKCCLSFQGSIPKMETACFTEASISA
jgi:hypothetical protein